MSVGEVVNANKQKFVPVEALALLDGVGRLVSMKGKRVVDYDLTADRPDDDALLKELIGPSGNLRAPALRVGRVMLVGFDENTYRDVIG